jgi:hypothetical protein
MRRPLPALALLVGTAACADPAEPTAARPDRPHFHLAEARATAGTNAAAGAALGDASGTRATLTARLSPANEVRGAAPADPVESVARGHAQVKLGANHVLAYTIKVHNPAGETFVLGHIHRGPAGADGPVVVDLLGRASERGGHLDLRGTRPLPLALAAELRANPAGFYVNLHTTQDPAGAIRGQLR